jgi:hypothetical protein
VRSDTSAAASDASQILALAFTKVVPYKLKNDICG